MKVSTGNGNVKLFSSVLGSTNEPTKSSSPRRKGRATLRSDAAGVL